MRGFTMILVVAYHVSQMAFMEPQKSSSAMSFFVLFRMPLFFFVSGFLAYKSRAHWSGGELCRLVGKKMRIQILPTVVFLCAYLIIRGKTDFCDGFMQAMASPTKFGYWFTWTLLHMFIIYYLFAFVEQRLRWRSCIPIILLWVASVVVYETTYMPKSFTYYKESFFNYSSLVQLIRYFQFFLLGNIVHRYWTRSQRIMDSKWFLPTVVILAFICCADIFKWHTLTGVWTNLPRTASMYLLLMIVVMFFRHYQHWFTREHRTGKVLQYIGVRTLDIYLLHYIFLPVMPMIGPWFKSARPNFVIDLTLSVVVALLVIAFCLITSHVLRISPFFKKYLFGK